MSDKEQSQAILETVLSLIEEGKVDEAVQRIVEQNTPGEQLELLRMLGGHLIGWLQQLDAAYTPYLDLPGPYDDRTLLQLRDLYRDLVRVHVPVRVLILALARTQVRAEDLARDFARAQVLAEGLAREPHLGELQV